MKLSTTVLGILMALTLVAFAGCKKKPLAGNLGAPMQIEGIAVDLPKLQASINAGSNADLQAAVASVFQGIRYRQYEKALMDLDKLASDANLTEEQKKLTGEVLEQLKQVLAKAPPAPQ
jgi:hypothetical protein